MASYYADILVGVLMRKGVSTCRGGAATKTLGQIKNHYSWHQPRLHAIAIGRLMEVRDFILQGSSSEGMSSPQIMRCMKSVPA